jgi:hypothetical protein
MCSHNVQVNYRPTWNLTVLEPVSGNYYPGAYCRLLCSTAIDNPARMTVLVDWI